MFVALQMYYIPIPLALAANSQSYTFTNVTTPSRIESDGGEITLNSAVVDVIGGGETIQFASGTDSVSIVWAYDTAVTGTGWDTVVGSNGTVYLSGAQTIVEGGDDIIEFLPSYNGGGVPAVRLENTGSQWDIVTGSGAAGNIDLDDALAQVWGSGESVTFSSGADKVHFENAASGSVNSVNGVAGTTFVTNSSVDIHGGGQTVYFWGGPGYFWGGAYDSVHLIGAGGVWDTVYGDYGLATPSGTVSLSDAQAQIWGADENIIFSTGADNEALLVNTAGDFDTVTSEYGATGTVYLTNALATITGGGDTVVFDGGVDEADLINTAGQWDVVTAVNGANGLTVLKHAMAQIWGGGESVTLENSGSDNAVQLVNTGSAFDTVYSYYGTSGTVYLSNAEASVEGDGDTVDFWSGPANVVGLLGYSNAVVAGHAAFGIADVTGFNNTDSLFFAAADQGKLSVTHTATDTVITLDANNVMTLHNYLGTVNTVYQ